MDFSKEISFGRKKKDDNPSGGQTPEQQSQAVGNDTASTVTTVKPKSSKQGALSFGSKKDAYPTKTHINLIQGEAKRVSTLTEVLLFILLVVLIGIFAKFAVVDPLSSGMESSRQVSNLQAQLHELQAANASKEGLVQEYSKYVVKGLTAEEQARTNRNDIIELLRSKVMSFGSLSSLKVSDNEVLATCADISLNEVSSLVQGLENDDRVSYVTVSTAQGTEAKGTSATISITMKSADEIALLKEEGANNG